MPNWCFTSIVFYSNNMDQIETFHNVISTMAETGRRANDFGNLWLGNFVDYYGGDTTTAHCRGKISYFEDVHTIEEDDNLFCFRIDQEDAWVPLTEMWQDILDNNYPDISFVYMAEECGCDTYINTDTRGIFLPNKWYVDIYDENDEWIDGDYFRTEDDVRSFLEKHIPAEDIEDSIKGYANWDAPVYAQVHEFYEA